MKIFCFNIEYVPAKKNAWKKIARRGALHKILAIKAYREQNAVNNVLPSIMSAKTAVEDYMLSRGIPIYAEKSRS